MNKVIVYLQDTLGEKLNVVKANKDILDKLPLYINNTYEVWNTVLYNKEVLLMVKNSNDQLTPLQYQKHMQLLEKKTGSLVVFILSDMKAYDRNRLTQKKINFIIEDKQIFIPQMLIDLKDYLPKTQTATESLQPAAQVMILYHIQRSSIEGLNYKSLANLLGYSYLTISRAVDNLVNLELCKTIGNKEKLLVLPETKMELWQKALPYMKTPIRKTLFVNEILPKSRVVTSGMNALAFYTDLNGDRQKPYAINYNFFNELEKELGVIEKSTYDGDYKVELWRYDPLVLTETEFVDPLSLYITYKESKDERIEMALEQIIEQIKW